MAPDWKEILLGPEDERNFIHSEVLDVDGDGDLDWVGARYKPGLITWLEQPENPETDAWKERLVDDQVDGIHGLLTGDVDRDGRLDLLATSAQPMGPFPDSLVWYRVPENPKQADSWHRFVFANRDAPGLSHYLGFGDVNGDGRPDIASAAKGGPSATRRVWGTGSPGGKRRKILKRPGNGTGWEASSPGPPISIRPTSTETAESISWPLGGMRTV